MIGSIPKAHGAIIIMISCSSCFTTLKKAWHGLAMKVGIDGWQNQVGQSFDNFEAKA